MKQQPKLDVRQQVLERLSLELLSEMLAAARQPDRMLEAILKQAMHLVGAPRGLLFGYGDGLVHINYPDGETPLLRRRLSPLLARNELRFYSTPGFAQLAEGERGVVGMAGCLAAPAGPVVVGLEREEPFSAAEQRWLGEWLELASAPAGVALEARAARAQGGKINLSDLPLDRLEQVPTLEQMERVLIAEALRRCKGNKTVAAATLGMTREGLRKKLLRLGM